MEKPGFYAILPSPVRYDRRLSASEKVFFAEITALSDQCGYCYAGNGYFSELYDTSDRTVQRWVKHLQELGYVAVTNVRDGAAMQRRISPLSGSVPDVPDKNVGERHPVSAGDKNVAPTPTKMSPTPRQKCRLEQYKNNNTRENNTRAGARESVRDVLRESFPWNERLTEALLAFEESRAAGKHPLTVNAASLACNKLNQLADEAGVRDRYGYMAAVLEQSILRGWEGLFPLKDDFTDRAPAVQPVNGQDRPREISPDDDITDFL